MRLRRTKDLNGYTIRAPYWTTNNKHRLAGWWLRQDPS